MGFKLALIMLVVMGIVGGIGYWYYQDTQERMAILNANAAKLEQATATQTARAQWICRRAFTSKTTTSGASTWRTARTSRGGCSTPTERARSARPRTNRALSSSTTLPTSCGSLATPSWCIGLLGSPTNAERW